MYKFYNAHPKQLRVNDCVVRAYCTVLGMYYNETRKELNRIKKELGFDSYKNNSFIKKLFSKYEKISFPAIKGTSRMDGEMFCINYPKGKYVLRMAGHLTCCIDGIIYDTWDCSEKCVYNAWKIK